MDLTEVIAQAQGGQGIGALSRRFNLNETQTRAAIDRLAPAVMAGIRRETASPDGLAGLIKALASGNHGRYLDGDESGIVDDGNAILGHVFGSKDVSRGVAAHAAEGSGIGLDTLKRMLPMIAAMIMGALGKKTMGSTGGGLGDILAQVLGGGSSNANSSGGNGVLSEILGQIIGQRTSGARPSSGGGGIGDILNGIFGSDASPEIRDEATQRAQSVFGEVLGGDTPGGSAADRLLESIQRANARAG